MRDDELYGRSPATDPAVLEAVQLLNQHRLDPLPMVDWARAMQDYVSRYPFPRISRWKRFRIALGDWICDVGRRLGGE